MECQGGVLGKEILAIAEDSKCSAGPAVDAANKVINQDGVHYIIGEVCSSATIPVSDIANPAKVIVISPTSTNPNVTVDSSGATKDFIFRACYIDPFQGGILANFSWTNLSARKAYAMYDPGNGYSVSIKDAFSSRFTSLGGTIVGTGTYTSSATDFSAILADIQAANPDVVLLPDYYNIVNLVTKQAKAAGITLPFIGADGWDSADLDLASAAGSYFTNHYSPDDPRAEVQAFLAAYAAAYKDGAGRGKVPDALAVLAYDATNLLLSSIDAAGVDDTTAVKAAIEGNEFAAVSGSLRMDTSHNPIKSVTILSVTAAGIAFDSIVQP